MNKNRELLLGKLDEFIRKYYINKLIKGVLLSFVFIISYILIVLFSEYLAYFSTSVKVFFILLGLFCFVSVCVVLIILPLLKLYSLGKRISYKKSVEIISTHFTDIDDKPLNALELSQVVSNDNTLLEASVDQRIEKLSIIPFTKAINLKGNYKYLKYLAVIILLGLCVFLYKPSIYKQSAVRMYDYNKDFVSPRRFSFQIINDKLEAVKGDDYKLKIKLLSTEIPESIYLIFGNNKYLLSKESDSNYSYIFHNVNYSFSFEILALDEKSESYQLKMISPPVLTDLKIKLQPPLYTRIAPSVYDGVGDISVPKGSIVEWYISALDADTVELLFTSDNNRIVAVNKSEKFFVKKKIMKNTDYKMIFSNRELQNVDIAKYNIDLIADISPDISVSSITDSINPKHKYFKGIIGDDYGFSSLKFYYSTSDNNKKSIPIQINNNSTRQEFYFAFDFSTIDYSDSNTLSYYFTVGDNDSVSGIKYTSTKIDKYNQPTIEDIFNNQNEKQEEISKKLDNSIKLNEEIREDIEALQESLVSEDKTQWQKQEAVSKIDDKRKQLENLIKDINAINKDKNKNQNVFNAQDSSFLDKQKQIEELMIKLMDPELQKLMDEFNELSKEFNKDKFQKMSDKMDLSYENLDKQMQRNLDMLKKYDVELQLLSLAKRLDEMADKQNKLANSLKNTSEKNNEINKNTSAINKIKEDFEKLKKKNSSLKTPFDIPFTPQDFEKLSQLQSETNELSDNNKNNKASGKMRHSADKMKQMADDLRQSLQESEEEQISVNIDNLKKILSKLIQFSFDQEELMFSLRKTNNKNPLYPEIVIQQTLQNEKYKGIQDSLYVLAAKSPILAELLDDKIVDLKLGLKEIDVNLGERRNYSALRLQQSVMTTSNDLALLLADGLEQMKKKDQDSKDCKKGCKKPGKKPGEKPGSKPGKKQSKGMGLKSLKEQQQSLKKMMQQMIKQMKSPGKQSPNGMKQMSKMLQGQEMYRNSVQKLLDKGSMGQQTSKILKQVLKMLEKTEQEISNFSIDNKTVLRQDQILTRLLEAENAEQERDKDKKRESKSVLSHKIRNPKEIFQYNKSTETFNGVIKNSNVKLSDFYRKLYLDYIIKLNNE